VGYACWRLCVGGPEAEGATDRLGLLLGVERASRAAALAVLLAKVVAVESLYVIEGFLEVGPPVSDKDANSLTPRPSVRERACALQRVPSLGGPDLVAQGRPDPGQSERWCGAYGRPRGVHAARRDCGGERRRARARVRVSRVRMCVYDIRRERCLAPALRPSFHLDRLPRPDATSSTQLWAVCATEKRGAGRGLPRADLRSSHPCRAPTRLRLFGRVTAARLGKEPWSNPFFLVLVYCS
jgi:hypothetical protein